MPIILVSFLFFLQSRLCTVNIACGCFCTAWFDFVTVFVSSLYGARIELVTCQSSDTTPTGVKGSMSPEILAWKEVIFKMLVIASLHKNLNIIYFKKKYCRMVSICRFKGVSRLFCFFSVWNCVASHAYTYMIHVILPTAQQH